MWCRRVRSQLSAYVDGELCAADRSAVAEHLSRCEHCSAERESLTKLTRMTSLVPEEDLPSGLHSRIMSRLAYAEATPVSTRSAPRRSAPLGPFVWTAIAGATATVAFAYVQGRTGLPVAGPVRTGPVAASHGPVAQPRTEAPTPVAREWEQAISGPRVAHDRPQVETIPDASPALERRVAATAGAPSGRSGRSARKTERDVPPALRLLPRELQPQPLAVTTSAGKPTMEMRASEPPAPLGISAPEILGMPGDPLVNSTGQGQPLGAEPIVAMEKETGMRMAGSAPVEEKIEGDEDEGLRSLRMFFEERNRTVPQPPALDLNRPRRNRKSL